MVHPLGLGERRRKQEVVISNSLIGKNKNGKSIKPDHDMINGTLFYDDKGPENSLNMEQGVVFH